MRSWLDPKEKVDTVVDYVFELINRLRKCRDLATVRMESEGREKEMVWQKCHKKGISAGEMPFTGVNLSQSIKLALLNGKGQVR
ncbi:hypothetical protein TNIN_204071 [Trichonephila inaurata madagascariensis]|uniref:Uncharacterized protein n=1 Tax=Trichonephila inaurata madagascariensis TaxID=2747483 RepID=A0A8X6YG21_9ARAC|nr:hypothetical protein TNIN_204071 [Trichonephila inaurata madagascariensis]